MKIKIEDRLRGKGTRQCRICGCANGVNRAHNLNICRRCFREVARDLGFQKYG